MEIEISQPQNEQEIESAAEMMAASEPWITLRRDYAACLAILKDPHREVYVGRLSGQMVGFVIIVMQGAFTGYLQTVCVHPRHRNRGIGGKLIAFAEERILKDSPNIFLCVSSFNPEAQRLYERLGYRVVGSLHDYIVANHAEILMRKTTGPITPTP